MRGADPTRGDEGATNPRPIARMSPIRGWFCAGNAIYDRSRTGEPGTAGPQRAKAGTCMGGRWTPALAGAGGGPGATTWAPPRRPLAVRGQRTVSVALAALLAALSGASLLPVIERFAAPETAESPAAEASAIDS